MTPETEPVYAVNYGEVLKILGAKEVEIQIQRGQLTSAANQIKALEAKVAELTPKPKKPKVAA